MRPQDQGWSVGCGRDTEMCLSFSLQAMPTPASAHMATAAAPWLCARAEPSWM